MAIERARVELVNADAVRIRDEDHASASRRDRLQGHLMAEQGRVEPDRWLAPVDGHAVDLRETRLILGEEGDALAVRGELEIRHRSCQRSVESL
jgi:hypothetical protein